MDTETVKLCLKENPKSWNKFIQASLGREETSANALDLNKVEAFY
jgi:hypothetical protein